MELFDLFGSKKKPEVAMDLFIRAMYGAPPTTQKSEVVRGGGISQ